MLNTMKKSLGVWVAFTMLIVGVVGFALANPQTSLATAEDPDGDGLIGCGEGTGLFSLFAGSVEESAIRGQPVGGDPSLRSYSMAELDLAGLRITAGEYRVYSVSADEHWPSDPAAPRNYRNDASTFESFYIQFGDSGPIAPRPTPDQGAALDSRYSWPGIAQTDFNNVIDFLGNNGGVQDFDRDLNTLPARYQDANKDQVWFDKGADLGVITLTSDFSDEIHFAHYFTDNTSTGFNLGVQNRAHYTNGFFNGTGPLGAVQSQPASTKGRSGTPVDYKPYMHPSQIFTENANSTNIGIIRIECANPPPTGEFTVVPNINGVPASAQVGDTFTVTYEFCNSGAVAVGAGVSSGSTTHTLNGSAITSNTVLPQLAPTDLQQSSNTSGTDCVVRSIPVTVPSSAQPGDEYCVILTATLELPGGGPVSDGPACVQITAITRFRVEGGDVVALGDIRTLRQQSAGSFGQYRVEADGDIDESTTTGFGSQNSVVGDALTFSNNGTQKGNFSSLRSAPDYHAEYSALASTAVVDRASINGTQLTAFNEIFVPINATGPGDTLQIGSISNFGEQIVLLVDGNVEITGNITIDTTGVDPDQLPFIVIVASGDITVAPGVTSIWASLIANGDIDTCNAASLSGCTNGLTINGVTAAGGGLNLDRVVSSGYSETFRKPAYLDLLNLEALSGTATDVVITQFRDLPPIIR